MVDLGLKHHDAPLPKKKDYAIGAIGAGLAGPPAAREEVIPTLGVNQNTRYDQSIRALKTLARGTIGWLRIMALVEACYRSLDEHRPVRLDEILEANA